MAMLDYISCRLQYVFGNGNKTRSANLTTARLPGSTLDPVLFFVFVNDSP